MVATGALVVAIPLRAQAPSPAWPFLSPSPGNLARPTPAPSAARSTPPPFDVPLRQERWEQLPDHAISPAGEKALALRPQQWRHGETENFIIHYRGLSDALQIAREIEFDLWYVAQSLGATQDQYARKSHVYVFADEKEWQKIRRGHRTRPIGRTALPWATSFSSNVNAAAQGGFDSRTLAHETTHAVVARIYGRSPLARLAERRLRRIHGLGERGGAALAVAAARISANSHFAEMTVSRSWSRRRVIRPTSRPIAQPLRNEREICALSFQ